MQLYFRDPAGNLIELNWPDASTLDRSRYPQLRRLVDVTPQSEESLTAVLYLEPRRMSQAVGMHRSSRGSAQAFAARLRLLRVAGFALLAVIIIAPALWVLFFAPTTGKWATSFGSAVHDPKDFLITLLNGVTAAALYFVVASGFTLIFGLMRVVNMAHGAFFLFGGYVALKVQRHMVDGAGRSGCRARR